MAFSINTNTASLFAQQYLAKANSAQVESMARLSSGLRVRSAADDAAGLAISEIFKADIRSLNQANRNATDGVSLTQTADGALSEISTMLTRMRELSVQASNGTLSTTQRGYLNDEFKELRSEIARISSTTEFNGVKLLSGPNSGAGISFQVGLGTSSNNRLTVTISTTNEATLSISGTSLASTGHASTAITKIDTAITAISSRRAKVGAMQNRLSVSVSNLTTYSTNLSAANGRIIDVDVAAETARLTKSQILVQAGISMLAQANQTPQMALSLLR